MIWSIYQLNYSGSQLKTLCNFFLDLFFYLMLPFFSIRFQGMLLFCIKYLWKISSLQKPDGKTRYVKALGSVARTSWTHLPTKNNNSIVLQFVRKRENRCLILRQRWLFLMKVAIQEITQSLSIKKIINTSEQKCCVPTLWNIEISSFNVD